MSQPFDHIADDAADAVMPDLEPADKIGAAVEAFIEGPAYTAPTSHDTAVLLVELGSFEGPLDLLLKLAREQKVDLAQISILALADQYLAYIHSAQRLQLEVAADYLVMAAWLAYLKSRLLIPATPTEEPNPADMAALLAFQLQRLEAMQKAGADLFALPQLGTHFFKKGAASKIAEKAANDNKSDSDGAVSWNVSLYELLSAMSEPLKRQQEAKVYQIKPLDLFSIEEAYNRLSGMLGVMPEWSALESFMPIVEAANGEGSNLTRRSALAATFVASLEMAKNGLIEIRQEQRYGHIFLRRKDELSATPNVQSEDA